MICVKDANEALNMLKAELFDLVMPEIDLQDISGIQLMEQIHQEFKLPVICKFSLYIIYDKNGSI